MSTPSIERIFESFQQEAAPELAPVRASAMKRIKSLSIPNRKSEEWRYTSTQFLTERDFHTRSHESVGLGSAKLLGEGPSLELLATGAKERNFGGVADRLQVLSLAQAYQSIPWIREKLESEGDYFKNLNKSFLGSGVYLRVSAGTQIEDTLQLLHRLLEESGEADFSCVIVDIEANASLRLLQIFSGKSEGLRSHQTVVRLGQGARLEIVRMGLEDPRSHHVSQISSDQDRDSVFRVFNFSLGGSLSRMELVSRLNSPGAELEANGLAMVDASESVDHQIRVEHLAPETRSRQVFKSIVASEGKSIFAGQVYIPKHSQKSDSDQVNKNLLLGTRAEVDTKPQLDVFADDVKATHGAAIGQLDPEELFYLMSRGIPSQEALSMLALGFVDEVVLKLKDKKLRESISQLLHMRLERFDMKGLIRGL